MSDLESVRSIAERTGIANEIHFAGEPKGDQAMLCTAWRIAVEVHGLQLDRGGECYLFHVARVGMAMDTPLGQVCGLLHDVLEDSPNAHMWVQVFEVDFPNAVLDCSVALCRKEGEDYLGAYIPRVAKNPLALRVKLADLMDNVRPERLAKLDPEEAVRLRHRYHAAHAYLLNALESQRPAI